MRISIESISQATNEFTDKHRDEIHARALEIEKDKVAEYIVNELMIISPNDKIPHIKILRRVFDLGLKESKELYERHRENFLMKEDLPF